VLGAVVTASKNTVACLFKGGPLTTSDVEGIAQVTPAIGSSFGFEQVIRHELVNVSANLFQSNDVGITQQMQPASITAGNDSTFVLSLTNSGPSQTPITLIDTVPAGLAIQSVSAGTAPCSVAGQNVSCTLSGAPANVAAHAPRSSRWPRGRC
jgi:uncharacterized repeat protein (TIGR01451 family)